MTSVVSVAKLQSNISGGLDREEKKRTTFFLFSFWGGGGGGGSEWKMGFC